MNPPDTRFSRFSDFYPYYLSEHADQTCRRLHFIGTTLVIAILVTTLITSHFMLLWFAPVTGYGFAWIGHYVFEQNHPATFKYPFYSLCGDFVMYKDMLTGKITF